VAHEIVGLQQCGWFGTQTQHHVLAVVPVAWQAVRRGHPARELAYTLITSLTPEDRCATQRDLLDDYRRALAAAGGPDLARDDLWLRYRQGAMYAYVAPLITAGMGGMQVEGIAMEGLRRGVAALDDLETIAALKSSL
jgi:hypothetical protein